MSKVDLKIAHDRDTEVGLAATFTNQYRNRLRYDHHEGAWYIWSGSHWRRDDKQLALAWALELCSQASKFARTEGRERSLRKTQFAEAVLRAARVMPMLAVTSDDWNRDPWLLATPSGTVDLRTGESREAQPQDTISQVTSVAPASDSECPIWRRFLAEVTQGDESYARFLQQYAGYCLTGVTREHVLAFAYGPGGNGKSVFISTLTAIMGDYAQMAPMDTFVTSFGDRHPTELARLRGARLVTASETEEGRKWAEARIKSLTGGDKIAARFMRQDFFEFTPMFKLLFIGNHRPILANPDDAMRRRFRLLPFEFKPNHPDRELEAKLQEEHPEILRWMIEGAMDWQQNSLSVPDLVAAATDEYFTNQNLFGQWMDEECQVDKNNRNLLSSTAELVESYNKFAVTAGEPLRSARSLSEDLQKLGFEKEKRVPRAGAYARGFRGIMLRVPTQMRNDRS